MGKFLVAAISLCLLSACSQSYSPVAQAALIVRDTTDTDATKEIDEFLASKGYGNKVVLSHPGDHKWYEDDGSAFIEIELNSEHCISFIAYIESGSTENGAAKLISQQFLDHFGHKWSIKRDQVCGKQT